MMTNSMDKAAYVWTEINKSEEEVAKNLTDEDAGAHGHANSVTVQFICYHILHETLVWCSSK